MSDTNLQRRIRRLEDRVEIDELIARYGLAMDGRDVPEIEAIFTPDAILRSQDGVMDARGHAAIIELYRGRFRVLGPSNHFTHDRIVNFDADDPDLARGRVTSHAEMNRMGRAMVAAIRYSDVYRRFAGAWRFAMRELSFMYYVDAVDYADALGPGLAKRMRAYGEAREADWPEGLESWRRFHGG